MPTNDLTALVKRNNNEIKPPAPQQEPLLKQVSLIPDKSCRYYTKNQQPNSTNKSPLIHDKSRHYDTNVS